MQDLLARDAARASRRGRRAARAGRSCAARSAASRASSQALFPEAFGRVDVAASGRRGGGAAAGPRPRRAGARSATRSPTGSPRRARLCASAAASRGRQPRAAASRCSPRPPDYKWVRVTRDDLGEPGCGHWHSRPRLGPLGMLMGWWRVKVSSGCPLAGRLAAVERKAEAPRSRRRSARRAPAGPLGQLPAGRAGRSSPGIIALVDRRVGRHPTAIGVGVVLAGLGGLEVAVREHFAGYRSHTTLLAGAVFVVTVGARLLRRRPDPRGRRWRSARSPSRSPSTWRAAHSSAPPEASASGSVECAADRAAGRLDGTVSRAGSRTARRARSASRRRWREVSVPSCLFSFSEAACRNLRARVRPQRRWLVSSSEIVMLSVSQGHSRTTSAASRSPRAIAASARRGRAGPCSLVPAPSCAAGPRLKLRSSLRVPLWQRPLDSSLQRNR